MAMKLRKRTLFPALVEAVSPIIIEKQGSRYIFSFNMDEAPAGPSGPAGPAGAAGAGYGGTSATSLLIANGVTKVFTTQAGLAYQVGNYVRASSQANGANFMEGLISGYSGTTLSIDVTNIGGAGTFADWVFSIAGAPGSVGVSTLNGQTGALALMIQPQGRITLTSGVSVTTSDVTGAATVYYTPAGGNQVPIWDGTNMVPKTFAELTLALDSNNAHTNYHQSGKNYDGFVINDAGTIRFGTGPKWDDGAVAGSDTARGTGANSTELELKNGVWTNKNIITIRFGSASGNTVSVPANRATYVGTLRMTADGLTEDSFAKRFVYNAFNQSKRQLLRNDATASWPYSIATFRQANAATANRVEYVAGLAGASLDIQVMGIVVNSTASYNVIYVGIGLDSTTVNSATVQEFGRANNTQVAGVPKSYYTGYAQLGYHAVNWLEKGTGVDVQTWIGTEATGLYKSGIFGGIFQ